MVVAGVTVIDAVVCPPGFQEYVFPPLAVKVADTPGQTVADVAVIGVKVLQLTVAEPLNTNGILVDAEE